MNPIGPDGESALGGECASTAAASPAQVRVDRGGDFDTLSRLFAERYSCRSFLAEPVPHATICRILDLAQRTASWCNAQPWQVVITSGAATQRFRTALYEHAQGRACAADFAFPKEYRDVYLARRRECGGQLYESVGIARGDRVGADLQMRENFRLFGAPHAAIITSDEPLGVYGAIDCGAYAANFMLAATSLGVASIAQAALAAYPDFVRSHFDLPKERLVICGISFGYADRDHAINTFRTRRAGLAETVAWFDE